MTDSHLPQSPTPQAPDVAERNVERLLEKAYKPEAPDPAFVRRVGDRLAVEASARAPQPRRRAVFRHLLSPLAAAAAIRRRPTPPSFGASATVWPWKPAPVRRSRAAGRSSAIFSPPWPRPLPSPRWPSFPTC
jgi:hypothetical protein